MRKSQPPVAARIVNVVLHGHDANHRIPTVNDEVLMMNIAPIGAFLAARAKSNVLVRNHVQTVSAVMQSVGLRTAAIGSQSPRGMPSIIFRIVFLFLNMKQISTGSSKAGERCTPPKFSATPNRLAARSIGEFAEQFRAIWHDAWQKAVKYPPAN